METAPLRNGVVLPPTTIDSAETLGRVVQEHGITQVVDLSSVDTVDCTRVCEEIGADFLCTSVEEWPARGSLTTDQAIARLLPPHRPDLTACSHLVGSGANPGIVNALAFAAMEAFAERAGVEPTTQALDLHSVLITEEDTTTERHSVYAEDVFPMTWSPEHCLEELFEPRAFSARSGKVVNVGHRPTDRWYRARCGERLIEGMLVPHEETKTLARRLSDVDIAFIYRLPPAAIEALRAREDQGGRPRWRGHRLFPPHARDLLGHDHVGVLLCSRQFGELWMGFETEVSEGLAFGTNATQLQVAAGVVAGWTQLGGKKGFHFVEDLDWRAFLGIASEILGTPSVVHDPEAPVLRLAERAVETTTAI